MDKYTQRLSGPRRSLSGAPAGAVASQWFGRVVGIVVGTAIAVGALFVSVIAFSVILVVGLVVGGWLWWRTREVRRRFREEMARMQQAMDGAGVAGSGGAPFGGARGGGPSSARRPGDVIDGDFIREAPQHGPSAGGPTSGSARRPG